MVDGTFRGDLYYRLAEVTVRLPTLAERREDIPRLVTGLLECISGRIGVGPVEVSEAAMIQLWGAPWPGNVRELQNALTRGALSCRGRVIEPEDIVQDDSEKSCAQGVPSLEDVERDHIHEALRLAGWNRGKVCGLLGITRPMLRRKMKDYGIIQPSRRGAS